MTIICLSAACFFTSPFPDNFLLLNEPLVLSLSWIPLQEPLTLTLPWKRILPQQECLGLCVLNSFVLLL